MPRNEKSDQHLNVLCVNVKDIVRAAERSENPDVVPPSKRSKPNLHTYTGSAYVILGDSRAKPQVAPLSPADGAVLEKILGSPMGKAPPLAEKRAERPDPTPRPEESEFKVIPPSPLPHQRGHWHDRRQCTQPKCYRKMVEPAKIALSIPPIKLASTIAFAGRESEEVDSVKWVDSIQLPSNSPSADISTVNSSEPVTTATTTNTSRDAELSPIAAAILRNTMNFLDHYRPAALEEPEEATTSESKCAVPSSSKPLSSRGVPRGQAKFLVSLDSEPESDSDSAIEEVRHQSTQGGVRGSTAAFLPRSGVTRRLPVKEPADWVEPQKITVRRRRPFQDLLNRPFELEIKQIEYEQMRQREMNVNKFNMKAHRARYRKAKPNLVPYGLMYNSEVSVHNIPGPFKRNEEHPSELTRRPKKK